MRRACLPTNLLLGVAAAGWAGCGSGSPAVDAGPADARDAGPEAAVVWSGSVYEAMLAPDAGTTPIENARVCVFGYPEVTCATTDAEGSYTMAPQLGDGVEPFAVHFTAAGHLGRVRPAGRTWWPSGTGLRSDPWAVAFAEKAGFTYPANGGGFVELRMFEGGIAKGVAGATARLSSGSGRGPVYADPSGTPDPALTATSTSGVVFFGDVAPGPVTITVDAPGMTCDDRGVAGVWPAVGPNAFRLLVAPGAITDSREALAFCH